jgi:hypothetical protein
LSSRLTELYSPVCRKQILNLSSNSNGVNESSVQRPSNNGAPGNSPEYKQHFNISRPAQPIRPTPPPKEELEEIEPELDEDITPFRRVVQEIIDFRHKSSNLNLPGIETIRVVLSKFDRLGGMFDLAREDLSPTTPRKVRRDFKKLNRELYTERLTFEDTAKRLLALSRTTFPESVTATSFEDQPWQMETVSQGLKLRLGLHSYNTISYAIFSVSYSLDAIISLFPQEMKASVFQMLVSKCLTSIS